MVLDYRAGLNLDSRRPRQALGGSGEITTGPPTPKQKSANFSDIPECAKQSYLPESALPAPLDCEPEEVAGKLPNAQVRFNHERQEREYSAYDVREVSVRCAA